MALGSQENQGFRGATVEMEVSPKFRKEKKHQIYPGERSPDMLMLDLFFSPFKMVRICQENVHVGLSYR